MERLSAVTRARQAGDVERLRMECVLASAELRFSRAYMMNGQVLAWKSQDDNAEYEWLRRIVDAADELLGALRAPTPVRRQRDAVRGVK